MPLDQNAKAEFLKAMDIPEFEDAIKAHLPKLLTAMFDLAEGVTVLEIKKDLLSEEYAERIYQKPPDRLAAQFLIENVIGKVPTRVEMTGKDGATLNVMAWAPRLKMIEAEMVDPREDEVRMLEAAKEEQDEQTH